jgi:hypothetical protein
MALSLGRQFALERLQLVPTHLLPNQDSSSREAVPTTTVWLFIFRSVRAHHPHMCRIHGLWGCVAQFHDPHRPCSNWVSIGLPHKAATWCLARIWMDSSWTGWWQSVVHVYRAMTMKVHVLVLFLASPPWRATEVLFLINEFMFFTCLAANCPIAGQSQPVPVPSMSWPLWSSPSRRATSPAKT